MIINNLKELSSYNEVIYALSAREIKSRYKQSVIGILWAIIQPFSLMVIFTIIFGNFFSLNSNENIPYPIFVYCTLVPWTFFARSIGSSTGSLVGNALLVTKIYFPKEILPISLILANIFDLCIASLILFFMMIFYHIGFSINLLYLVPLFFVQLIFTLAISLFLSAANVFYRDIANAIALIIQIWMYATPIIYSTERIPVKYQSLYLILNPMAPIIEGFRNIIVREVPPDWFYLGISSLFSLCMLIFAYLYFKKAEIFFSDVI
jgi:lipopolysaccharide transport system permease protein